MSKKQNFTKTKERQINPGIHSDVNLRNFSTYEQEIILNTFATEFYVTTSGGEFTLGKASKYRYVLIKPTNLYQEQYNLEREIVVVFSDYEVFEPRTLDAFDYVFGRHQDLRLEKICSILISKDKSIESKIISLLSNSIESQVIVPFTYEEVHDLSNEHFLRNRITKHFYSRDLFAQESALKKDMYFFGRTDLVHDIINRHKSGENCGLFGLRKTGKTSIVFAVQRTLDLQGLNSVYIDCQDTSFYMKRWNKALMHIITIIKSEYKIKAKLSDEELYTEDNCSWAFRQDLEKIKLLLGNKPILIIFDEVERITFNLSSVEHWKDGGDFIHFWSSMRSLYQSSNNLFSYLIISTNPMCVEVPTINNEANPIFAQIPFDYIPPFDVPQTKEMVERLSYIMGLRFDEIIYSKLTEDFGGHPFLMRMLCSILNEISSKVRPVRVDKSVYEKGREIFNERYNAYIEMVIIVLKEYYNDEYEMLRYLALDDFQTFNEFVELSSEYTNHLLGYNILDSNNGNYYFKIDSVKRFLKSKNKYLKIEMTTEEMLSEISERRNRLEPLLRKIIRTILMSNFGEQEAANKVRDIFGGKRKLECASIPYKDLFNPNETIIYFEDLRKIIEDSWNNFEYIFNRDKLKFRNNMTIINKYRADAHAKDINIEELSLFRTAITEIENQIDEYYN